MTTRARKLREEARQALYSTPNDQECEVPIMVATLRAVADRFATDWGELQHPCDILNEIADELEAL